MNFKTYDILSTLIPGFVILLSLQIFLNLDYNNDYIIAYTAIAFIIGFVVNTLSSWFEDLYFWTWKGKPSDNLLNGKGIWKVHFYEANRVKELLIKDTGEKDVKSDRLFCVAMRVANGNKDTRVGDFNALYAFSRVLLTTFLIVFFVLFKEYYTDWRYYTIFFPAIYIAWLRCKQRGYYYAREVLNEYLNSKKGL